jgi:hypothetical protein
VERTKFARNLRTDIAGAHGQEDQIGESVQATKSRGAVLEGLDDTVDAFADGIGQRTFDEVGSVIEVV